MQKLRLDRRLANRRGWIQSSQLQSELDALPDVADKALQPGEEPVAPPAPTADAERPAAPSAFAPDAPEGGGS